MCHKNVGIDREQNLVSTAVKINLKKSAKSLKLLNNNKKKVQTFDLETP